MRSVSKEIPIQPENLEFAAGGWLVLRTRARQEKAVARYFISSNIPYFLPQVPRVTVTRGRKHRSRVPLFPGYIFICGQPEDAYGAISNKRICQIITPTDQLKLVQELSQIRLALESEAPLELYPYAVVGRRCRIRIGPLAGVEGVLIHRQNQDRFVLQVNMIGQGASLEVDADLLEPVDDAVDVPTDSIAP